MSSRALRRLQHEASIIRVSGGVESSSGEEERPGFPVRKTKKKAETCVNPFAVLVADADDECENDCDSVVDAVDQEVDGSHDSHMTPGRKNLNATGTSRAQLSSGKKKKRKRKISLHQQYQKDGHPDKGAELEEVDAAIKEVNEMLGDVGAKEVPSCAMATSVQRPLLGVEKRFLNADNEMRRIFGSRVVRAEGGGGRHQVPHRNIHRRVFHKHSIFAKPKDTWPKMDKPGLTMELSENKNGCQFFTFKHSSEYQKVQFQFLEAVETFEPNTIVAVLRVHPYHIDSLLQLSEVCRMGEDAQMATELLERALYCFECSFHTLFNMAHGNCRFNYSIAENRPFFIALFRHLYYTGRKGCHRTALEFCKLLLSLDPEGDPLGILLMIDYYALRGGEHKYLLTLFQEWEKSRNLSQLPNFAFSIPLAMFHAITESIEDKHLPPLIPEGSPELSKCNAYLQEALVMFPNVLIPLMDKCGVTLDPAVSKHAYFTAWNLNKDPSALQLLQKLFIERNHSLWKAPEVLTWLEQNAREVVARVDAKDPLVADSSEKRERRYVGTPRNIYRHVIMSDFSQVTTSLPQDLGESGIMMYDPLPPLDSTSSYTRPPSRHMAAIANENPLLLFLRSILPTFENLANAPVGAGGVPIPHQQRLQAQLAAAQQAQEAVGQHGVEGQAGRPLDLQGPLNELAGMLQQVLDLIPGRRQDSDGYDSTSSEDR